MTDSEQTDVTDPGVRVAVERIDAAAQALATADGKNWGNADVRARYRGLALVTIGAYLTGPPVTDTEAAQ